MKGDTSVKIRKADYDRLNKLRGPFTIAQVIGASIKLASRLPRDQFRAEVENYEVKGRHCPQPVSA